MFTLLDKLRLGLGLVLFHYLEVGNKLETNDIAKKSTGFILAKITYAIF